MTQKSEGNRLPQPPLDARLLAGKVALVTGGSRGIGRAIVSKFAEQGARVVFSYVADDAAAGEVVAVASEAGREILASKGSVASAPDVKAMVALAKSRFGRIDILVNNAGIKRDGFLMVMKEADWDAVLSVNLKGAYLCCREVLRTMVAQKSGRIINVSSLTGLVGQAGQANYAASKGGLVSLTKALAKEAARFGISVNCVAPGFIETDMMKDVPRAVLDASLLGIPMARFGRVDEVATAALFLASDMASFMTGQVLQIDGGQAM